jgi:hypothetical protein
MHVYALCTSPRTVLFLLLTKRLFGTLLIAKRQCADDAKRQCAADGTLLRRESSHASSMD